MSGQPAARLSDAVSCPKCKPNTIASGSADVLFDGLPSARQGDRCACGAALSGKLISNVLINGRAAAVQGSTGEHGNVVIGGSGTVIIGTQFSPASFTAPSPLLFTGATSASTSPQALQSPQARIWQEQPGDSAPSPVEEEEEEEELEESVEQLITLRVGVFFDGTGNNLANSAATEQCRRDDLQLLDERTLQETARHCAAFGYRDNGVDGLLPPDNSYANSASNVALLHGLYKDQASEQLSADTKTAHVKIYLEGIGTSSGGSDSIIGSGTGNGETGIVARVRQSPAKIREQLIRLVSRNAALKISHVEFDIFGFSRGAAAARHFANELLKPHGGLLAETLNADTPGFAPTFDWQSAATINFIGLFDTVAAVVDFSRNDWSPADESNPGINLYLPAGCARKVVHLTAKDEKRWNFSLSCVTPTPGHTELTVPGVHSDIGGGYPPNMIEKLLLTKPLSVLVTPGRPLQSTSAWQGLEREQLVLERAGLPGKGTLRPVYWRANQPAGHPFQRDIHQRFTLSLSIERQVRGELALVYLRLMRELAVGHGVPFDSIDETDNRTAIPKDLQAIAEKLMGIAAGRSGELSPTEQCYLRERYIHLSAHWTPTYGLLINKPAPNIRLTYNNKPQEGYPE
ncbi:DUF2235 domain-containing protein [Pseudomonas sp. LS44]|uniref:PAAR domain-containing protein n=1 Tax=Pseudomonas sp. LS44 TaxID=1357074 RepID=UPI00215A5624|nr:PAAR domain-containing protein [Pseudomonas sp. LS44]UVE17932.1 DUF2235 domain-containing protein [Pseudomonas sp. LS44]